MENELTHVDLFSGIGGFALACRWNGIKTVQFVEIDKFCQKVLKKNFPGVPIHDDIKTYKPTGASPFILTGGFPCQPFSCAGKQRGTEDNRYLWPEMLRVISEAKPRWVIGENVRGFISNNKGMVFENCCLDLEREGYQVQPFIIPAVAVNAPHRRDRVWIVANRIDKGCIRWSGGSDTNINRIQESEQTGREPWSATSRCNEIANTDTTDAGTESMRKPKKCSFQDVTNSTGGEDNGRKRRIVEEAERSGECGDSAAGISDKSVTDTEISKCEQPVNSRSGRHGFTNSGGDVSDAQGVGLQGSLKAIREEGQKSNDKFLHGCGGEWSEPWLEVATRLCGIFNGLSEWMDRNSGGLNAKITHAITGQDMPHLWDGFQSEAFQWSSGRFNTIHEKENLFTVLWQLFRESNRQDNLPFESATVQEAFVRNVWINRKSGCSSQRWEYNEQYAREHSDSLSSMSHEIASLTAEITYGYGRNRVARLKALGNAVVPQIPFLIMQAILMVEARAKVEAFEKD